MAERSPPAASRLTVVTLVVSLAAAASTLLPARAEEPRPEGPHANVRVGLVFDVGGRGDKSFNDAAYEGLSRAARELGVTTEVLEPSGSEDREAAMRLFGARGFDLVIGVGFIFSTDVNVVARDFPSTRFACIDYAPPMEGAMPPNVSGLRFREEEGSFLVGAVAGLMSKTGHVGFVGGMDIPLIRKFEAGYRAGVHEVCPRCEVHAAFAGTTPEAFRDPVKGKALANSEIAAGADIVYHAAGTTGHGVFEASRDMGVKAIGVDADQHDEMPGTVLTSMIKRGDVAVFDTIRDVAEGRFQAGLRTFGLAEGAVGYVDEGPHAAGIPEDTKQKVEALAQRVIRGEIKIPER
ncbi:BMP family lipoprotein [Polyangium mundeleinium]|uniref:BMP family ABC transporter substrate-binding protein n=1 Tax=Polyangium mundeleinium TaxID=2995306 RepID=A0ABT5EE28_9BACT|nr:BMP family ABC transporter substrate-binding protein [Polyangium mundeleinium]MDC0740053.1 BMP family ABC transporter substrate-binding protein [Polyangium mundeleinium]